MRIAIAADHNGVATKSRLIDWLTDQGHDVDDRGTSGTDVVDYPPLCLDIGRQVLGGRADRGIMVGGTGGGECIACNKMRGIRAGLCHTTFQAEISSAHNATNVLVLGARIIGVANALVGMISDRAFRQDQTQAQRQAIDWIKQNVDPAAVIIIDNYAWVDLRPQYQNAHSFWRIDNEKAIRDDLLQNDWRRIDYVALTPVMQEALDDGKLPLVAQALDHSELAARFERDGMWVEIRRVSAAPVTVAAR